VSGATQIRAGVQRPEIVAPLLEASTDRDVREDASEGGLKPGDLVRVIRQPYFGKIGRVTALPPELMPLETEAKVRVLEVDFGNESKTLLPRANVEMIES
jgi:transcription antitermination factor NusG